jgi:hypothetical protein
MRNAIDRENITKKQEETKSNKKLHLLFQKEKLNI